MGGILGALGSGAIAKGYNIHKGKEHKAVTWSHDSLLDAFRQAVMLYLSVSHFGRGQGEWQHKKDPEHWLKVVNEATNRYRTRLMQLWARTASEGSNALTKTECFTVINDVVDEVFKRLYPECNGYFTGSQNPENLFPVLKPDTLPSRLEVANLPRRH